MSNSQIEVTNEFIKTNYGNFIQYFEEALYLKYETSFTSLIEQFYITFSIMKDMLVELLSLKNLVFLNRFLMNLYLQLSNYQLTIFLT